MGKWADINFLFIASVPLSQVDGFASLLCSGPMPDCCRICLAGAEERNSEETDDEVGRDATDTVACEHRSLGDKKDAGSFFSKLLKKHRKTKPIHSLR